MWSDTDESPQVLSSKANVSAIKADMYKNIDFVRLEFEQLGFTVRLLASSSLPVFFAEKIVDAKAKTIILTMKIN